MGIIWAPGTPGTRPRVVTLLEGHLVLCRQLLDRQAGDGRGSQGRIRPCVWAPRTQSRAKRIKGGAERPAAPSSSHLRWGQEGCRRDVAGPQAEGWQLGAARVSARRADQGLPAPAPGRLPSRSHTSAPSLSVRSSRSPGCRSPGALCTRCCARYLAFQLFPPHCLLQKAGQIPVTAPLRFESLGSIVFLVARYCAIPDSHMNPERLISL